MHINAFLNANNALNVFYYETINLTPTFYIISVLTKHLNAKQGPN